MSTTPPPYDRQATFTSFHTEPAPTVGQDLEAEFNKVKQSLDATQSRLSEIQRDDGRLANLSVHPDAISNAVRALLAIDGDIRGEWQTGLVYNIGDVIEGPDGITYLSTVQHVGNSVFAVDVNAGRWISIDSGIILDAQLRADITAGTVEGPLRADLASSSANKGSEQVAYRDTLAPAFLKTISDIINAEPVSVLRAIDRTKHAGIFAGTNADDHATAINSLMTAMSAAGRGHLVHEAGTVNVGSQLTVPADVLFTGGGVKSVIKPLAAMTSMIAMTGDYAQVRDLNLQNVASRASRGISITSPFFAKALDNFLGGFAAAIYIEGAQKGWVERNHVLNCSFGIYSANDAREFRLIGNHVQGGTGIWITQSTQQAEGVKIAFNTILPSITSDPNSGHGLVIEAGLEMQIISNMFGNCDKNGILLAATGGNAISCVKIAHGWCDNDSGSANSEGLFVYGNVSDVTVTDCTFANANQRGVHIGLAAETAPQRIDILHSKFLNNGSGDIQLEKCTDVRISGNRFNHATSNLREEVNTINSRVYENTFIVAPSPKSTASRFYDNNGPSGVNDDNGTYTPTLTAVANVASSIAYETTYMRVGDTVTVAGRVDITPTAAGATLTQLRMTLPKTSNFTGQTSMGGTGSGLVGSTIQAATMSADPANDDATLSFYADSTASHLFFFTYTYRVL